MSRSQNHTGTEASDRFRRSDNFRETEAKKYGAVPACLLDLTEKAGGNVVDKATNGDNFRNPRMGADLLQLVPDIIFNVLEAVEIGGSTIQRFQCDSGFGYANPLRSCSSIRVGVIDDHEFLGTPPPSLLHMLDLIRKIFVFVLPFVLGLALRENLRCD